jgi:hypothetical protein
MMEHFSFYIDNFSTWQLYPLMVEQNKKPSLDLDGCCYVKDRSTSRPGSGELLLELKLNSNLIRKKIISKIA